MVLNSKKKYLGLYILIHVKAHLISFLLVYNLLYFESFKEFKNDENA